MAIHILFGPGGSGKSYYQCGQIVIPELIHGVRNIVTNLALNLPQLQALVEEKAPDRCIDVTQRVRLLTESEAREFWRYRGPNRWSDLWDGSDGAQPVPDSGKQGCVFIIDEAGVAGFSATGWATQDGKTTRGEACSWYLDQQRKFGDDVYASVNGRHPHGIAKPFRDKAHVFIKLKNGYQASLGMFKGRGRFTASHFVGEPAPTNEPFKIEHWSLDAASVGRCYRTQDGVGVAGVKADIGKRAKGIPILMAIPLVILLGLVVAVGIPMLLAKGVTSYSQNRAAKMKDAKPAGADSEVHPKDVVKAPAAQSSAPSVLVTGVVRAGRRVTVMLSDGRSLTEQEPYLRIERTYVESPLGVRYSFARPQPKPPAPVVDPRNVDPKKEPEVKAADYKGEALFPPSEGFGTFATPPNPANASGGVSAGGVRGRR